MTIESTIDHMHRRRRGIGNACSMHVTLCIDLYCHMCNGRLTTGMHMGAARRRASHLVIMIITARDYG